MQAVDTRHALREVLSRWRRSGERIALVPTMGNLHEGHLSLVRAGRRYAGRVVSSIYVNPSQFGEGEDFEAYPRTLEADLAKLEAEGCDLAFTPASGQVYPFGLERAVMLRAAPDLAGRLEGRFRPGHFAGVVSVVARLFAIVQPDVAVFGEKDFQQLLVIRRMVDDLGFNIEVAGEKTVRTGSGLALSSRNAYLDAEQTRAAGTLNRVLAETVRRLQSSDESIVHLEASAIRSLEAAGLRVDYVAVRRAEDLAPPGEEDRDLRVLAAARCGRTRLIDNMAAAKKMSRNSCNRFR